MKKKAFFLILLYFLLLIRAYAHDNQRVHPIIITKGVIDKSLSIDDGLLIIDTAHGGGSQYSEVANYYGIIQQATIDEDNELGDWFGDIPFYSMKRHFYNPINGKGLTFIGTYDNSIVYGKDIWNAAIWHYKKGSKLQAYYKLGRVLHLLEDASSPPHVYGDNHINVEFAGIGFNENASYEAWGKEFAKSFSGGFMPGTQITQPASDTHGGPGINYDDFIHEVASKTFHFAAIRGNLKRSKEKPVVGDLAQLFPPESPQIALAYMVYPGVEFLDERWIIVSDGDYYYYDDAFTSNDWWPISMQGKTRGEVGFAGRGV